MLRPIEVAWVAVLLLIGCQCSRTTRVLDVPESSDAGPESGDAAFDASGDVDSATAGDAMTGCFTDERAVYHGDFQMSDYGRSLRNLFGVEEVTGTLTIGRADSEHLDELACLRRVGSLYIVGTSAVSLRGLSRLESVEGNLQIVDNEALRGLEGLSALRGTLGGVSGHPCPTVQFREQPACEGRALVVAGNAVLESLAGLEGIEEVKGDISIENNWALRTLALPGLESAGRLLVSRNRRLESIGPLTELRDVDGVHVLENEELTSLALPAVDFIDTLRVGSNRLLESLDGLEGLRGIGSWAHIVSNARLRSIEALRGVRQQVGVQSIDAPDVGDTADGAGITVALNFSLTSLRGLHSLETMDGTLSIFANHDLVDLQGLEGLVSVGGSVFIESNHGLDALTGLETLQYVGGELAVVDNMKLTNVDALSSVQHAGSLRIERNPELGDYDLPIASQ